MKRIIFVLLILILTSCNNHDTLKVEETRELMGTFVIITVYDIDEEKANNAINVAFDKIERIDDLMSSYKNDSEVSILNRHGFLNDVSPELKQVLDKSIYYGNLSKGFFDVTVKPILDLYSYSFQELGRPPTELAIDKTLKHVDFRNIVFVDNSIILKNNAQITLGGIAKGYAIDEAILVLEEHNVKHALVNAGGDMKALGSKLFQDWKIALQNPRDENDYIAIITLNDKAVATSGDYERYFDENKSFHHIVNPKTGYSATSLISVTIVADEAVDADALATSVFVLGFDEGINLIESLDNVEGLIITRDREIVKSSGFD